MILGIFGASSAPSGPPRGPKRGPRHEKRCTLQSTIVTKATDTIRNVWLMKIKNCLITTTLPWISTLWLKTISTSSHRKRVTHGHRSRLITTIRSIFHQNCSAGMSSRMALKKSETTARQIHLNFPSAKVAIWWRKKLRSGGG